MNEINITLAKYTTDPLTNENVSITAVINGKTLSVALDPANRHYAAILDWVAEGNTIQPADSVE